MQQLMTQVEYIENSNNEHFWNLYFCLKILFATKINQSFLEKWLVLGPEYEVYMTHVECLDIPESKESSKTNRVMSKNRRNLEEVSTDQR